MFHIMIVEDDDIVRQELKQLLMNALYQVTCVVDFRHTVDEIQRNAPDLLLLDMNLPEKDGLTICRELRAVSQVPIIFVTGNTTSMDELNCLMQGGDDYITKPYQGAILLAHIAAVLKRTQKVVPKEETSIVYNGVTLDLAAGVMYRNTENECSTKRVELSKNEIKILYYLIKHQNMIAPRVEIIEYLWDNQVFIDDNTLSVNVTRLRTKLDQIGAMGYIETKRGMGYKV